MSLNFKYYLLFLFQYTLVIGVELILFQSGENEELWSFEMGQAWKKQQNG